MPESKNALAYKFAEFAHGIDYDDFPDEVKRSVASYVMDWFGCCVGALDVSSSQSILRVARELNGNRHATVLGAGDKMEVTLAAMVNGTFSHALEMDDDHRTLCGHPGVAVIPAALAISEKLGLSGKQFLEAVALGYELMIRTGTAFLGRAYYAGWHPTSTCGVFGAAASASKAMGLSAEDTATAFGLAGSMSGGTLEYHIRGTFAKRFHPGNAARNGILAAMMAQEGFTGPWSIFEGKWGWLTTHCEKVAESDELGNCEIKEIHDGNIIVDGLGSLWHLLTNSYKVHTGGRFGATSIDAALEIVEKYGVKPDEVESISIGACDFTMKAHFVDGCERPANIVAAQFSLPFAMALVLYEHKVSVKPFLNEDWTKPEYEAIMDKVEGHVDPEAEEAYPEHYLAKVSMTLKGGRVLSASVEFPRGDPENPPTEQELQDKFRDLAGLTLPRGEVEKLLESLLNIESIDDVRELTALAVK